MVYWKEDNKASPQRKHNGQWVTISPWWMILDLPKRRNSSFKLVYRCPVRPWTHHLFSSDYLPILQAMNTALPLRFLLFSNGCDGNRNSSKYNCILLLVWLLHCLDTNGFRAWHDICFPFDGEIATNTTSLEWVQSEPCWSRCQQGNECPNHDKASGFRSQSSCGSSG